MTYKELASSIFVTRNDDKGTVSFTASCPYCTHVDFSVVHYGDEKEAKAATVGKMVNHCVNEHKIILDNE